MSLCSARKHKIQIRHTDIDLGFLLPLFGAGRQEQNFNLFIKDVGFVCKLG